MTGTTEDGGSAMLPRFDVRLTAPDLRPWLSGNTSVPGFWSFDGPASGPHVAIIALTHGNEIAGAIVLEALLRAGLRPLRGRLTFGFANLGAFERFDPRQPTASRFVDEDFNRLWDASVLDGPRQSAELMRAREIRPLIDTVDVLLDLHSMLWPSDPLMLSGGCARGRAMARAIGVPPLVVSDHGHASGLRLIDYTRFSDPAGVACANLLEAGQHWEPETVAMTRACVEGLLRAEAMLGGRTPAGIGRQQFAEVTLAVSASSSAFAFVQPFRGGDVVRRRNTLIAVDGTTEIRTPHPDCLLVMPSLRPSRGHTAVRLARFIEGAVLREAAD